MTTQIVEGEKMVNSYKLKQELTGVITGASSGIGRALAIDLAKKYRAKLVINARRQELLEETANLVRQAGGEACVLAGDIGKQNIAQEAIDLCLSHFGKIDILVNNAGLAKPGPITSITPDDWQKVFSVNFFGAIYATYAALPHFLKQKSGKIVNVSSVAGKVSFPGSVCYSASKFAMTGFSEGLAAELAPNNIDVITVCPGWVRTEFFENNQHNASRNPTFIARRSDLQGWLMRNHLSISSEDAAREIIKALNAGGSREIVLTTPGVFIERLSGIAPQFVAALTKRVPASR